MDEEERKNRKRQKQAKTNGINFKIIFGQNGYTQEQKEEMKMALVDRYKKAKVKGCQNYLIVNSGVTATLEGVKRAAIQGLGKKNRHMIKDIILLKGYHAFQDEESDSELMTRKKKNGNQSSEQIKISNTQEIEQKNKDFKSGENLEDKEIIQIQLSSDEISEDKQAIQYKSDLLQKHKTVRESQTPNKQQTEIQMNQILIKQEDLTQNHSMVILDQSYHNKQQYEQPQINNTIQNLNNIYTHQIVSNNVEYLPQQIMGGFINPNHSQNYANNFQIEQMQAPSNNQFYGNHNPEQTYYINYQMAKQKFHNYLTQQSNNQYDYNQVNQTFQSNVQYQQRYVPYQTHKNIQVQEFIQQTQNPKLRQNYQFNQLSYDQQEQLKIRPTHLKYINLSGHYHH